MNATLSFVRIRGVDMPLSSRSHRNRIGIAPIGRSSRSKANSSSSAVKVTKSHSRSHTHTRGDQTSQPQPSNSCLSARRLILLRHAHSSWDNPTLRDHDRPLSKAGKADATNVSHKLQQLGWIPRLILCSDATRTRETLQAMQEQVRGFQEAQVHFFSSFYSIAAMDGQTAHHLQQIICEYSRDHILTVMCMGHNRGWEEAASLLTGASIELKTCNAALLEASGKSWEEAFLFAGVGGWKLQGIVKPDT